MLDPKLIRQDFALVAEKMKQRGTVLDQARLTSLEDKRKDLQVQLQDLQNERNVKSKLIGQHKAKGESVEGILAEVATLGDRLKKTEIAFSEVQDDLQQLLAMIPNMPHDTVPVGKNEEQNQLIREWGKPTQFSFAPKDHVELGMSLGMDFTTAAKLSGARFVLLRNKIARLHRALAQFMLDLHTKQHGYQEVHVPYIVNADSLFGTGQLPKLKEDIFAVSHVTESYLIPTAEVSITNIVREEILELDELPLKFVCHSPCFRSEAGSYGKDTKGMIRQHQFDKVELVQIVHPDYSYQALEELTSHAEAVLKILELPYRVMALCTGDLGFAAAKTYDLEVWLPGQQQYREISSCSNTEAFQARRMKARYRHPAGKPEFVHTLNGSALAVGRTLVAIMENFQDENGRIHIPSALQPFMDNQKIIE